MRNSLKILHLFCESTALIKKSEHLFGINELYLILVIINGSSMCFKWQCS